MSPIPKWLGDTHTAAEQDRLHPPLLLDNFSMEPYLLLQPDAYGTSANDGEKITYKTRPVNRQSRQVKQRTNGIHNSGYSMLKKPLVAFITL